MVWRATWQDARRHGVIKVPLSMGNCNPPISLSLFYSVSPSRRSHGGENMYIRADYHSRYYSPLCLSFPFGLSLASRCDVGWSLYKPPHLLASVVLRGLRWRGRRVARCQSGVNRWKMAAICRRIRRPCSDSMSKWPTLKESLRKEGGNNSDPPLKSTQSSLWQ